MYHVSAQGIDEYDKCTLLLLLLFTHMPAASYRRRLRSLLLRLCDVF